MGRRPKVKKPPYTIIDYDRRGRPRIYYRPPGQRKVRLRGPLFSDDFWADYQAARDGRLQPRQVRASPSALPPSGTFARLVVDYYGSPAFRALNPDTRYRKRIALDKLRERFGEKVKLRHVGQNEKVKHAPILAGTHILNHILYTLSDLSEARCEVRVARGKADLDVTGIFRATK